MKKKGKLKKVILLILIVLILVGAAGAGVRYWMKNRGSAVTVESVASINNADWFFWGDEEGNSGTIVSDVNQSVRVPDDKVVKEVYVEEGDKVKIGDKLLSYDTTLLELDKELQELNVQEIELEIKSAEADLVKLRNTTPVERPAGADDDDDEDAGGLLEELRDSGRDEDDDDDEARLFSNEREMLAAAAEAQTEEVTPAETQPTEEEVQAGNSETQPAEEGAPSDNGQTGEGTQTESGTPESDQTIENEETIIENLTPEDLDKAGETSGGLEFGSIDELLKEEDDVKKPKMNQSLSGFLTNVRIKERDDQGNEILLADTVNQAETGTPVTAYISKDKVNLILHFKEDAGHRFEKLNTYTLYIKGIKLKEQAAGRSYGTDVIDGEDYPEIGGFTLVPYTKAEADDVAKLTLAFHDGLDEQHEQEALLEDMYLEIPLNTEELTAESLIFRTSDKEAEDMVLGLEFPGMQAEEAVVDPAADGENPDDEEELPVAEESETTDEEESESDTEQSESTGETDGSILTDFYVTVQWNHGTNDRANWPGSLTLLFYEHPEASDPVFTRELNPGDGAYNEAGGSGATTADDEPETEPQTEPASEASGEETEPETVTEAPLSEAVADPTDPYTSTQIWPDMKVNWAELNAPKNPNEYYMTVFAENYIPTITWDGSAKRYTIVMNYLEPEESPLIKLNPLSELNYASGAQGKYYKGSGTKEDPYVFFCTDGAIIRNTFVNWVLGFNELGTERVSDGYYVVLEIRESDSITGAFIKSVGLDGTIRVEHGYGPGTYWIFTSDSGIVRYEEDIPEEEPGDDTGYDPGWEDLGETYTAEELAAAIEAKEKEIRQLKVDEKKARLDLKKYTKELEECNVVSAINGYVKSIGGNDSNDAYLVVASEEGLYLKSTVSEMDLDSVEKGQTVSCTSWDTGAQFNATITQIDYFPSSTEQESYWGSGNSNSSNYPILAVVEDAENLSEYESISVKIPTAEGSAAGKIYIAKMYIRSENGQSYVYIADENNLLKKQYIRTGGSTYGMVEIKEGLTEDDRIAFPYGKDVKEGAKVADSSEDEDF